MSLLWPSAVTIHLLAAATWIGGMIFLSSVLAPLMQGRNVPAEHVALFRSAARRFRLVVWLCIITLLMTGPILLHAKNISLSVPDDWPAVLRIKLGLVAVLLLLTVVHGVYLGPRARHYQEIPAADRTLSERVLMMTSRWLPRLSLFIGAGIVMAAVVLARS